MATASCTCLICHNIASDRDMKTVRHVEEHGWSLLRIVGGQFEFAYTVGLWHTFRRAEVVMFGLGGQGMQHWLNACVDRCRDAGWPAPGEHSTACLTAS